MSRRDDQARALIALEALSRELTQTLRDVVGVAGNVEAQVLLLVHEQPGISPGGVAATTGLQRSAVSRALATLEELRWTSRRRSPVDARSSTLHVTAKGLRRIRRLDDAVVALFVDRADELRRSRDLLTGGKPSELASAATGLQGMRALASVGEAYGRDVARVLVPYGVGDFPSRSALTLLADAGSMRPSIIGRHLGLGASGTSDLLDRLGGVGLIDRRHDDDADRRAVNVRLTTRGTEAAEAKLDVFARHAGPIAAALDITLQCAPGGSADTA